MSKVVIDYTNCSGCKLCYKACFIDVIRWDEDQKRPIVAYEEDCVHCNYCEISCAKKCIDVIPEYNKRRLYQTFNQYR